VDKPGQRSFLHLKAEQRTQRQKQLIRLLAVLLFLPHPYPPVSLPRPLPQHCPTAPFCGGAAAQLT